jgi:galactose mutarotase-like enzyme
MDLLDKGFELEREVRRDQGFAVYVLGNPNIEVAVVPELGAKIISLKNLRTGRDWVWHPADGLKLFRNRSADDFSKSPLVGVDECLPTVAPCSWRGRNLPDHGEAWNSAWNLDPEAWTDGLLRTSVRFKISPLDFERTMELRENEVCLSYRLHNRSETEERFVWAMHPLLDLRAGDQLVLPASTRAMVSDGAWIDALDSAIPEGNCSKVFAGPLSEGFTGIQNRESGERLEIEWNPAENAMLGLWLTRGGWHGHHHFAIEPTNAGDDSLAAAAEGEWCGAVPASGTAAWEVRFRISP